MRNTLERLHRFPSHIDLLELLVQSSTQARRRSLKVRVLINGEALPGIARRRHTFIFSTLKQLAGAGVQASKAKKLQELELHPACQGPESCATYGKQSQTGVRKHPQAEEPARRVLQSCSTLRTLTPDTPTSTPLCIHPALISGSVFGETPGPSRGRSRAQSAHSEAESFASRLARLEQQRAVDLQKLRCELREQILQDLKPELQAKSFLLSNK
eukprot:g364.t1